MMYQILDSSCSWPTCHICSRILPTSTVASALLAAEVENCAGKSEDAGRFGNLGWICVRSSEQGKGPGDAVYWRQSDAGGEDDVFGNRYVGYAKFNFT
jgi:hypothetical protein